jgi:hypothetical protein
MTHTRNPQEAKMEFQAALAEKYTIKMLLFGSGSPMDDIAQKAQTRAALISARRVIRVYEPEILTTEEQTKYRQNKEENVVCVLDLDGEPVRFLTQSESSHPTRLEQAFAAAQQHLGGEVV